MFLGAPPYRAGLSAFTPRTSLRCGVSASIPGAKRTTTYNYKEIEYKIPNIYA